MMKRAAFILFLALAAGLSNVGLAFVGRTTVLRRCGPGMMRLQAETKGNGKKIGFSMPGSGDKSHESGKVGPLKKGGNHQTGSSDATVSSSGGSHGADHHNSTADAVAGGTEKDAHNEERSAKRRSTPSVPGLGLGQSFDVVSKLPSTATLVSTVSQSTRSKTQAEQLKEAQNTIDIILRKVDKLEKALADGRKDIITYPSKRAKAESELDDFMNSLKMKQIALNPQNVERCSMFVFFVLGGIIGTSIFHRFWLLGGLVGSWWASDAVNRDTKYGLIARRAGVRVAQFIRDLQERWNYVVVYYETGRLAYASQKRWEKIDKRFKIDERFKEFKKLAMSRATQLNSKVGMKETLQDVWAATKNIGAGAAKIDTKYGVTEGVRDFSKGLYLIAGSRVGSWLDDVRQVGSSGGASSSSSSYSLSYSAPSQSVNPWLPAWMTGSGSMSDADRIRKDRDRKRNLELAALRRKRERDRIQRSRGGGRGGRSPGSGSFYSGYYKNSNGNGSGKGFFGGLFGG